MTVVIDPGHGGSDPGASSGGVVEKDLALIYALALGGELCRLGVPVIFTRTTDVMPGGGSLGDGLRERARIANNAGARGFVSVHFNASRNVNASGIWLLHMAGASGGEGFAEAIQRELGGAVYPDASGWTGNRGLAVLRGTRAPAVLLEYGFLTNAAERQRLQHVERLHELVAKTAAGIVAWIAA